MMKTRNIIAIAAVTALLAALPAFSQEADAAIRHVPVSSPAIGFDKTVSFVYDIESGKNTYSYNTYAIGCTDRLTVTSVYAESSNKQSMAWSFPDEINYLCDQSELADYTGFALQSVDWSVQSDNNPTFTGSSNNNAGTLIDGYYYSSSGQVYGTFTAHYEWTSAY